MAGNSAAPPGGKRRYDIFNQDLFYERASYVIEMSLQERSALLVGKMCCADERDRVQKKTFTKWVNKHLMKAQRHISDLYEDLRDGHNLISLLEVLSGETLPREKGRMRFHKLQNVQIALDFLKHRQVWCASSAVTPHPRVRYRM
uniref:Calponin-homology (CH) domain-containing protein n=1 Tax=Paramormyrops kingsleyae TaxID=1676925 RepID=A0A3B3T3B6_9TELE